MGFTMAKLDIQRKAAARRAWFMQALNKRAPVLSGGDSEPRGGKFYGRRSNYGALHQPSLSPQEFYEHFRFQSTDMNRLCQALRIPSVIVTTSRCRIDGEEAMLMYLKVTSDLSFFINNISVTFYFC